MGPRCQFAAPQDGEAGIVTCRPCVACKGLPCPECLTLAVWRLGVDGLLAQRLPCFSAPHAGSEGGGFVKLCLIVVWCGLVGCSAKHVGTSGWTPASRRPSGAGRRRSACCTLRSCTCCWPYHTPSPPTTPTTIAPPPPTRSGWCDDVHPWLMCTCVLIHAVCTFPL